MVILMFTWDEMDADHAVDWNCGHHIEKKIMVIRWLSEMKEMVIM